jgi:hypothetical protein
MHPVMSEDEADREQHEQKEQGIARGGPNKPPPPGGGAEKGDSEPDPEHGIPDDEDER